MSLTGQQMIGTERTDSQGRVFYAVNPATGERLSPAFCEGTEGDVDRAAQLAERDFDAFRATDLERRGAFLEAVADELIALGDQLLNRAAEETGLPKARLEGERGRTVNQLRLFAQLVREGSWLGARIDRGNPGRTPLPKPDVRMLHLPLGPVAVFGASNFPLAFSVAGGDTASALAAGCPVVVKGHPAHPGTSELAGRAIVAAIRTCGMPAGSFSLVQGSGHEVGIAMARHPLIKAVAFTGSLAGGRALFDQAATRPEPIPVFAEMGSINPVFLLPGALRERGGEIATGFVEALTLGVGQFCTNPGVVFAIRSVEFESFASLVEAELAAKPAGIMLHAGIRQNFHEGATRLAAVRGVAQNGETGPPGRGGCAAAALLLRTDCPTFLANPTLETEVFGPASLIVECDSYDDMLAAARHLKGQLTATIHGAGDDSATIPALARVLERKAGRLIFNGFPTGVEVCHAMTHGGPYPATTDSRFSSVGTAAINRFLRPVSYQNFPVELLPETLRDGSPLQAWRLIDGVLCRGELPRRAPV
ncbi:aldehyde dehydrogenase (NADP(+)) [Trichloromonas sp.]|uniref:aldehyde dehydrogenase (NADP(+)) n=1 Tax=Trichloromonas sp. TaxID=3069249 RepID=UPI003D81643D